ncbi:MAG: hypothetical protein E7322_09665 [Clostridiales bacterium]|nr:hypothetical protein [Clostridiales bacterium]
MEDEEEEADEEDEEDEGIDFNDFENTVNLIGYLKIELTEHSMNVPLGKSKRIVDVDRCLSIIDDLVTSLPKAMRHCWRTKDENDRILQTAEMHATKRVEKAKEDAERIVDEAHEQEEKILEAAQRRHNNTINDAQARADAILRDASERAKRMVSENAIVKNATAEANRLITEAKTEARERRLHAAQDAYRLLDAFEKQAASITTAISRRKNELGVNNNNNR